MATILVVDDRPVNRELITKLLGYSGHRMLEASDGVEALRIARTERPDLIVADILMPTMDGYEFVRQLRLDPSIAAITVIFWTAHYLEPEARALAASCGVSLILMKPSEPETIVETINMALSSSTGTVQQPRVETFNEEHVRVLTDKVAQKAEDLHVTNEKLQELVNLGLTLGSERDPGKLIESFVHASRTIIGARFALAAVFDEATGETRHAFASGLDRNTIGALSQPARYPGSQSGSGKPGTPLRLNGLQADPESLGLPAGFPPVASFLSAPIVSPTRNYGWLGLTEKLGVGEFSEQDERLAVILAAQAGRVYENGRMYQEAQEHARQLEREVRERKRADEELNQFFDQSINLLCIAGFDGYLKRVNPAWHATLGLELGELMETPYIEMVHPSDRDAALAEIRRLEEGAATISFENRILARDGSSIWVLWTATPIRELDGFSATGHDITERKRLEAQLQQAQKMEAIGRLAGGIAHDFNNLLTVITGYSEVSLMSLPAEHDLHEPILEIKRAGERAASLTRQLLAFSRKQVLTPIPLDLNELVEEMDRMLRRLIGEDIVLRTNLDADVQKVMADPGQIEQVIMNLAVNARDAMPEGGRLTIETGNRDLDQDWADQYPEVRPGRYVMLAISDTGVGIRPEDRKHLFEPFFTTKPPGQGTGLGLATVYGIIKQSGGHVTVYSEPGSGTTFKVYLPEAAAESVVRSKRTSTSSSTSGTETILLVEDEESVRLFASQAMRLHGYTVIEAADGTKALEILQQGNPVHIIVTDVVMPQMSGRQLANEASTLLPDIKVLFMSGYTDNAITHHGVLDPGTAFIQKPFSASALARKVRDVLDAPRSPANEAP